MTATTLIPVRNLNLVTPLLQKSTAMRTTETGHFNMARSGAVSPLIGSGLRRGDAPDDTGLPIGNLSSQFFANVHLDALDQFCKHQIGARHYVRYVDDFILLHESPQWLHAAKTRIEAWLPERLSASSSNRLSRSMSRFGSWLKNG